MYTPPPSSPSWDAPPNWYEMPLKCFGCRGDTKNWKNEPEDPEAMATCAACRCHFHATCMKLGHIADVIKTYAWKCDRCSRCEICNQDDREELYFYCYHCNRAWHTTCLTPSLPKPPTNEWKCPACRLLPLQNTSSSCN